MQLYGFSLFCVGNDFWQLKEVASHLHHGGEGFGDFLPVVGIEDVVDGDGGIAVGGVDGCVDECDALLQFLKLLAEEVAVGELFVGEQGCQREADGHGLAVQGDFLFLHSSR